MCLPSLHIIMGPMYSGKTTNLMFNYNRLQKYKQLIIDYKFDSDTEQNLLYNHNKDVINCIKIKNIVDIYDYKLSDVKIIHINEAQFFNNLKNVVLDLIEEYNTSVYLYGLDGDFKREKFGELLDLIPYCDSILKLRGSCYKCSNESVFSYRTITNSEQIIQNNDDKPIYIPLCRKCYLYNLINVN